MPPPVPGPPLALAVSLSPGPSGSKPMLRLRMAHIARAEHKRLVPPQPASRPTPDAPSGVVTEEPSAAFHADALTADARLSAEEAALIEERRQQVAEALYRPGQRELTSDAIRRGAASEARATVAAEDWTPLDHGAGPVLVNATAVPLSETYYRMSWPSSVPRRSSARPTRLVELTPEEQRMILARRGMSPESAHSVRIAGRVKLLKTENLAEYMRSGAPAVPISTALPEIPAALLDHKGEWTMVAQVRVARDGAVEVAVIKPIPDAALNQAVDDAIRRWRFRPTSVQRSETGRRFEPENSTIELSVKLSVG